MQINLMSVTSAKLGMLAVSAWGGRDSRADLTDFLPFDLDKDQGQERMDEKTKAIAKRLIKTGKLPLWAAAIMADELK